MKGSSLPIARRRTFVLVLFCACVFLGAAILHRLQTGPMPATYEPGTPETDSSAATPADRTKPGEPKADPIPVAPPPERERAPDGTTTVTDDDLNYIAARNLLIPVAGVTPSQLRDTFNEARSEGRQHNALDIMAPQGTPVLATTDGAVLKLFQSDRGGVTLYHLDPSGRYVYYYAHLIRYEYDIAEGKQLRRGDVIAYVGDTGNAGAGKFHLHFGISKLKSPDQWSGGDPINPYSVFVLK